MKWYCYHSRLPHLAVLKTPGEAPPSWFGRRDDQWHRTQDEALKARLQSLQAPITRGEYEIASARQMLIDFKGRLPAETRAGELS